jgi:hypothetical protein
MYNIVLRHKDSKAISYTDAVSYFGNISQSKFDLIFTSALTLWEASQRVNSNGKGASSSLPVEKEFGLGMIFHIPQLVNDYSEATEEKEVVSRAHSEVTSSASSSASSSDMSSNATKQLLQLCSEYVKKNTFTMDAHRLAEETVKILRGSTAESTQIKLFELIGEAGFEFMFAVLEKIETFKSINISDIKSDPSSSFGSKPTGGLYGMMTAAQTAAAFPSLSEDLELLSINQRRKREKKEKERTNREAETLTEAVQDPSMAWLIDAGFSEEYLEQERMLGLHGGAAPGTSG